MKTLKESLLGNTEDALAAGDDMAVKVEEQFKALAKDVINIKNYNKVNTSWYGVRYSFVWTNDDANFGALFNFLGYDCDALFSLFVYNYELDKDWTVEINMNKHKNTSPNGAFKYVSQTYNYKTNIGKFKSITEVISKCIKPAFKNINAFKKFLNDLEKNGTPAK